MPTSISFSPIGFVRAPFGERFGIPRQAGLVNDIRSELVLLPELQPELSLQGLEGFSHLWVVWYFHRNPTFHFHAKIHPPRLKGKTVGLFATRSPHRPNPIGLSLVAVDRVDSERGVIVVRGADIMDGTPILDVKPYIPEIEAIPEAKSGWCQNLEDCRLQVTWSELSLRHLVESGLPPEQQQSLKKLIEGVLSLDPRPPAYFAKPRVHVIAIEQWDCHFHFTSEQFVEVLALVKIERNGK